MQTQAERLIARFGGISAMARALNVTRSVVQGWQDRGAVPGWRIDEIFVAGQELDPPLTHPEFFDPHALHIDKESA